MRDPHLDKLAHLLVNFSTNVKPGELVRISGDACAAPALEAIYDHVLKAGGHPMLRIGLDNCRDILLQDGNEDQLGYQNPIQMDEAQKIDVSIGLWADTNTRSATRLDPTRLQQAGKAHTAWRKVFFERAAAHEDPAAHPGIKPLRWVGTQYPTLASAQDAEMSLREYERFVFEAGALHKDDPIAHWQQVKIRQQRVADYLNGKSTLRLRADNGTDLTVDVSGMRWINCWGESNFPDGEVFTGPNLGGKGINGTVNYSFPAVYGGHEVCDVELTFENGRVVDEKASKGLDYLRAMLNQDEGARNAGEIAVGTNYQIQQFSRNTLFDEKIGGTFHLAVGAGYPETGNTNESALHWDMVCDMRQGGTIEVDGEIMQRDGQFVFDGWPGRD